MGNCTSNKYLADTMPMSDDDEEASAETVKRRLIDNGARKTSMGTTELKIRITKRELEKLLSQVDVEELPVTELLSQLIDLGDAFESTHRRSWRPSLHSIPEVN